MVDRQELTPPIEERRGVEFPEDTWTALSDLSKLTNTRGRNRIAKVVQDALRVYEWIIYQQAEGKTVIGLKRKDVKFLEDTPKLEGERKLLGPMFSPRRRKEALAYFDHPSDNQPIS